MTFLPPTPAAQVAETARLIWEKWELSNPDYEVLARELKLQSAQDPGQLYWQDVFALGADGKFYPKHALIVSILSAPFYGIFGDFGFWIFNQIVLFLHLWAMYLLAIECAGRVAARKLIYLFCFTSPIFLHSYGFSYDLFASAVLLCGFYLLPRHHFFGGLVLSLTLSVRPTNVSYLPFLLIAWLGKIENVTRYLKFSILGLLLGIAPLLLINWKLWGSPFDSAYFHLPMFREGQMVIDDFSHYLSWHLISENLKHRFWSLKQGLFIYYPFLFLMPLGLFRLQRLNRSIFFTGIILASSASVLVIFSYSYAEAAGSLPRFLLPAMSLLALVLSPLFSSYEERNFSKKD